jgi:DNA-binding MurR/RpiR family transcriptional regulator
MAKRRRTMAERARSIFRYIESQPEAFPKSQLQDIGLNPTTADSWLRLIEYIQNQPRIRVTRIRSSTYIEKLENRYLSMLRKRIFDSDLSLKEREQTMNDYVGALISLERIEMGRIRK